MERFAKQLFILLILILAISGISYGIYSIYHEEPTCFDDIQNQGEEGVDCGIACGKLCAPEIQTLSVEFSKLLKIGNNKYDFVAQISNPNLVYASRRISYDILFKDSKDNIFATQPGTIYILPMQKRYVVHTGLSVEQEPVQAELVIKGVEWWKVKAGEFSSIDFKLRNEQYSPSEGNNAFYRAVLFNDSEFDFARVDIRVILFDDNNYIVAINRTDARTFLSFTERYFQVTWPHKISVVNPRIVVEATTNVFEEGNLIRQYGDREKFQQFYEKY